MLDDIDHILFQLLCGRLGAFLHFLDLRGDGLAFHAVLVGEDTADLDGADDGEEEVHGSEAGFEEERLSVEVYGRVRLNVQVVLGLDYEAPAGPDYACGCDGGILG